MENNKTSWVKTRANFSNYLLHRKGTRTKTKKQDEFVLRIMYQIRGFCRAMCISEQFFYTADGDVIVELYKVLVDSDDSYNFLFPTRLYCEYLLGKNQFYSPN